MNYARNLCFIFFNEVATDTQNYPRNRFHFLMSLKSENNAQG
jgi:hypothetical protein